MELCNVCDATVLPENASPVYKAFFEKYPSGSSPFSCRIHKIMKYLFTDPRLIRFPTPVYMKHDGTHLDDDDIMRYNHLGINLSFKRNVKRSYFHMSITPFYVLIFCDDSDKFGDHKSFQYCDALIQHLALQIENLK